MKVILLQDVARIGKRFEVKDVPDGHALNMLIPKGMAEAATPENVKRVKARADQADAVQAASDTAFSDALATLSGQTVTVTVEANEQGHLFEALKADVIVAALKSAGASITVDQVAIETPIKEVGTHTVALVAGEQKGAVEVVVAAK